MPTRPFYTVPGFSRYHVVLPFAVQDVTSGQIKTYHTTPKGNRRYCLKNDDGQWRYLSDVQVAALAFQGQPPSGHLPWHMGGELKPSTVVYWPAQQVRSRRVSKLTPFQQMDVREAYLSDPSVTQRQLAERYGVSRSTINHVINRR
ncbi:MAG: hypothetical protein OHK0046_46370 [Anaerolineae bacterium]